jgi:hypothetical protein
VGASSKNLLPYYISINYKSYFQHWALRMIHHPSPRYPPLEIMEELKIGLIIPRWEGNK